MRVKGKCHCGNMQLEFFWPEEVEPVGRACSCGYCMVYGAVWISNPKAILVLPYGFENRITIYRFGHKTADFCFCKICGVLCLVTCDHGGVIKSVVNIRTFETPGYFLRDLSSTDFSREGKKERLERRTRNWSPVRIS
ncbi:MAG: hypothetical protein VX986_03660 [Pseudomonadota bacterium]|nr:hypothetical protein [Pseudomonadota bacterium]